MTLRLYIVCSDLRPYGSGHDVAIWRLAEALARRGDVQVVAVTGRRWKDEPAGVRVVRLPCIPIWHFSILFFTFRAAWSIYRRFLPPDAVVYLSSPLWSGGDLAAVHFLSGRWIREREVEERFARGSVRLLHDHFRHWLAERLERPAYRRVRSKRRPLLLPVGPAVAEDLAHLHNVPATAVEVVPNIVEVPPAGASGRDAANRNAICAAAGWPLNASIILFVGGAWHRKRPDRAVEALRFLPDHVVLLVVGAGPADQLRALARRCGVHHRIHFTGALRQVADLYRMASVLVLPSDYETDGLVALEAMACGVPVVAAPCRGFDGWLIDGKTGLSARHPQEIAAAVQTLLDDPQRSAAIGQAGRALTVARAPEVVAARVVALARRVLDGRARG